MGINEIEVNTSVLSGDIDLLKDTLSQLNAQTERMFFSVSELDEMWDGPASEAFNRQFHIDYQSCKKLCSTLAELVECLQHAREEYDSCEQDVDSVIRAINI